MKRLEEIVEKERENKDSLIFVWYPTEENREFGFLYQSGAYFVLNIVHWPLNNNLFFLFWFF